MNKTKILWLAVALLAVMNLATIATIAVHNIREKRRADMVVIDQGATPLSGSLLRRQLGFDDKQMEVYRNSNREFRRQAGNILAEMDRQKGLMQDELASGAPDSAKLYAIAENIGSLHASLKKSTVDFYRSLDCVCDMRQKEKLAGAFAPLFAGSRCCGNCMRGAGGGCCGSE